MITNKSDIDLVLAVWLLYDDYDHQAGNKVNYISVTSLMRPLRQIILGPRVQLAGTPVDLQDMIPSAVGSALHTAVEHAWTNNPQAAMYALGLSHNLISRVRVNPSDDVMRGPNDIIPVYLEQRAYREHMGFTIGGKFDLVTEGIVKDTKSTSVWTYIGGKNNNAYRLQMSLYRWLDAVQPVQKIHEDYGAINFIFTDWSRSQSKYIEGYPQSRIAKKDIPLLSLAETEAWVELKLTQLKEYMHKPEAELPYCTEEELWRSDPQFKYYSDPNKTTGRSTRNFDSKSDAAAYLAAKGKGVVIPKLGEPKRCNYCPAFNICTQKDQYFDVA